MSYQLPVTVVLNSFGNPSSQTLLLKSTKFPFPVDFAAKLLLLVSHIEMNWPQTVKLQISVCLKLHASVWIFQAWNIGGFINLLG